MEDPMLSPITVEVAHAPFPRADLVVGHVAHAAVSQAHAAPSCKRQGNMVMQGGNPATPTATARAPGANTAVRSWPAAEKAGKAACINQRKVPASRKIPYSTSDFIPPQGGAPAMPFNDAAPPRASGGSSNATTEFMNMLDTNAVGIDQASFEPFNYNEMDGDMDDHVVADELEEIEAEVFEHSQAKSGKSQRSKNYTILEDHALIQAWRCWENIKPMCSPWAACLEQEHNAPPSGTVEPDYDKISQHRYKDMEASEGKFFKLEHCWELLQKCKKWKLIDKESPPKRGSLINMDEDEDDDGPRNLHKPDGDRKTKEKMKREQEAASFREKIDAMVL
ncbi:Lactation elevated protein 1 [Hordeum vulgare]|nr:Lactation elevated protein 1 [Hordeum vulgare]